MVSLGRQGTTVSLGQRDEEDRTDTVELMVAQDSQVPREGWVTWVCLVYLASGAHLVMMATLE